MKYTSKDLARFWGKVDKTPDCWNWTASTCANGYGRFRQGSKTLGAHRFSYEVDGKAIPEGHQIDHLCFNRRCVNPSHLRAVTAAQNQQHQRGPYAKNTSGYRGVSRNARLNKWHATARLDGKTYHVGYFTDVHEAGEAVRLKRLELFTHNNLDRAA